MRLLLITDNNHINNFIKNALSTFEADELAIESIPPDRASLAALEPERCHAALIDGQPGEPHVRRLLDALRARAPQMPVAVLVDPSQTEIGAAALDAGADDVIAISPLTAGLLTHRLQTLVTYQPPDPAAHQPDAFVQALHEAATAMNSALELEPLLDRILAAIRRVIPYDAASVLLIENEIAHVVRFTGYADPNREIALHPRVSARPDLHQIATTGKPCVIADTRTLDGWADMLGPAWVRSHAGLPLYLRDDIVGFLNLESRVPSNFTPTDVKWLQIFAEQLCAALYNTRLYHDELKRQQEIEALRETTTLVSSTLELDRLMELLLRHLQTVVPYEAVTVLLVDGDQLEVVTRGGPAAHKALIGTRIDADQYVLFRELSQTRRIVSIPDARADPRFDDWDLLDYRRSWLGVPLLAHGACIGYLIMDSDHVAVYQQAAVAQVQSFANQAAIAIYNAQLYEEVRRYANELEDRVARRTAELYGAKAEIEKSEQRYRTLFEATFEGICVHDQGLLLDINPAFAKLFGYTYAEMVGMGMQVADLITDEFRDLVTEKIRRQDERPYEAMGLRKDGTTFAMEVLGKRYLYEGRLVRVAAVRNITERKELERRHLELALERERMQILSSFITQASHEFRTPLAVINMNAEILERLTDSEDQKRRTRRISESVDHITVLVSNMMLLARLDNEKQAIQVERIDLNQIVRFSRQALPFISSDKPITFAFEMADEPLWLAGDPEYVQQALDLLLENAIRFTEAGNITVRTWRAEDRAMLEVTDTGPGISAGDLPHIFERFYRADKIGTTRGFGLGLSIVKKIVERHHGTITVESVEGSGSTFRIAMPLLAGE